MTWTCGGGCGKDMINRSTYVILKDHNYIGIFCPRCYWFFWRRKFHSKYTNFQYHMGIGLNALAAIKGNFFERKRMILALKRLRFEIKGKIWTRRLSKNYDKWILKIKDKQPTIKEMWARAQEKYKF